VFRILTLNNISKIGLAKLPKERYETGDKLTDPDAILLRSADLHSLEIPAALKAVGRAGAGVNNVPVARMSQRGIPVFNAPGANANAVKELVVAGLIIGCRHLCHAWDFARSLEGTDKELHEAVEGGKKKFAGIELPGRTLGVVGLGAIGRLVANTGVALGMKVVGYDPGLTVEGAWQLSASVGKARSVEEVLRASDFVTFHVPLVDATRNLLNAERLALLKDQAVVLNFAREGIVDDAAVVAALDAGRLSAYVCDFPNGLTKRHPKIVALPHLGASTREAEDNCAVMVAEQVRAFLEDGHVRNAVNFPEVVVPRSTPYRLICAHGNVNNILGRLSEVLGNAQLNAQSMLNMSKGDLTYMVVDLDAPVPEQVLSDVGRLDGVMMARVLPPHAD